MVVRGWGREEMESSCLIDIEFQFYKMKRAMRMNDGNGCTL